MRAGAVEDCPRPRPPHPRLARHRGRAQQPLRDHFNDDLLVPVTEMVEWMMLGLRVLSVWQGSRAKS